LEQTIVAIDVGSTKICTLIAEITASEALRVIGVGIVGSRGVREGVVTDMAAATQAIGESLLKAERVSGLTVQRAFVSVGGSHLAAQDSRGSAAIGRGDRPVDADDIQRALEEATAISLEYNRAIIQAAPREFVIDGRDGIRNPTGLLGYRMELDAHIVTGAHTAMRNLRQCVVANDVQVLDMFPQPWAAAKAVLTDQERDLGVALLNVGGGTTELAVYVEDGVRLTKAWGMGGAQLTRAIAEGLRTAVPMAEELKVRYGHALASSVRSDEEIEILVFGSEQVTTVPRKRLCEIVQGYAVELVRRVHTELAHAGLDELPAGIVLTGGSANLVGLAELIAEMSGLPVRIGVPLRLQGLAETISDPAYAAAVGLLHWGRDKTQASGVGGPEESTGTWYERVWSAAKTFMAQLAPRG